MNYLPATILIIATVLILIEDRKTQSFGWILFAAILLICLVFSNRLAG